MGNYSSALYDVPRPNPKNPLHNKCSRAALTREQIENNEGLDEFNVVNAEHYCNSQTENPDLVAGFQDFAALAEQNPAKYGSLLYKQIKQDLEKNLNPLIGLRSVNLFDSPTEIKAVLAYASGGIGVSIVTFNALATQFLKLYNALGRQAVKFAKVIRSLLPKNLFIDVLELAVTEVIVPVAKYTARLVLALIKNPIGTIAKLAISFIKISVKYTIKAGVFLGKKIGTLIASLIGKQVARAAVDRVAPWAAGALAEKAAQRSIIKSIGKFIGRIGAKAIASLVSIVSVLGSIFNIAGIGLLLYDIALLAINLIGQTTIKYEISFCNYIGDRFKGDPDGVTEWAVYDNAFEKRGCYYNSADRGYKVATNFGCGTKGDCAIIGSGLRCVRQNFRADPFVCCFQDYECNTDDENTCFQTPARQRTCHPLFRDLSTNYCRDIIYDYCAGDILLPEQNDWLEMWVEDSFVNINAKMSVENNISVSGRYNDEEDINTRGREYPIKQKQPCVRAIARAVSTAKICSFEELKEIEVISGSINGPGFIWSKKLLERVYQRYTSEGGSLITGINTDGFNRNSSFYNTLLTLCNKIPGLCTDILNEMCNGYTAEEVAKNPLIAPWCSCYLPEEQYEKYSTFGITRECTPLCNRPGVIPSVSGPGRENLCLQNICIIDDVTVDIINTQFSGGEININQVCGSCGLSNVKDYYSYGSLFDKKALLGDFGINPPPTNSEGAYTEVYGSGFDLTLSGEQISLIVPKNEGKPDPNNLSKYSQCILYYASTVEDATVGIIDVTVVNSGDKKLEEGEYVFGFGTDGEPLYNIEPDVGSSAIIKLLKLGEGVDRTVSKNTTKWGQTSREASVNTCSCISSGFSLSVVDSKISGKINFTQECGSSNCYDANNNPIECSSVESAPSAIDTIKNIESKTIKELEKNKLLNMFFSAAGLAIIVFIFYVAVFFYKSCFKIIYALLNKLHISSKN